MADYRLYTIDRDGHFTGCQTLTCKDDAEAIEWSKRMLDGSVVELWSGARYVLRIDPDTGLIDQPSSLS